MILIDGDRIITEKMSIIDYINAYTDEGVTEADVVEQTKWIPCSERLPFAEYGESDNVLTTCCLRDDEGYRFVRTLYYNGGGIWCYPTGETFENRVIAWMPIPEAWKGDENGR